MRALTIPSLLAVLFVAAAARADTDLQIAGGTLTIEGETDARVLRWVQRAAEAVSSFYGKFPAPKVTLRVRKVEGRRVFGTTYGSHLIVLQLGEDASDAQLDHDWTLTHEMFHLAFPDVDRKHLWMQEGMATYFEPLARVRLKQMDTDKFWMDSLEGFPKGLPAGGDQGLDRTPTWGRIYWGGALFWFLADMEIREKTHDKKSADDAMRAILSAGGHGDADWPVEKVLSVGDKATGTDVLTSLYSRMATHPYPVDLDAIWKKLGVKSNGEVDDAAPEAAMRHKMTDATTPPAR